MFLILREWLGRNRLHEKTRITLHNHSCPVVVSRLLSEALADHLVLKENLHRIVSVLPCCLQGIHQERGARRKRGSHQPRMTAVMSLHSQREVGRKSEVKILLLLANLGDSLFLRRFYRKGKQYQERKWLQRRWSGNGIKWEG